LTSLSQGYQTCSRVSFFFFLSFFFWPYLTGSSYISISSIFCFHFRTQFCTCMWGLSLSQVELPLNVLLTFHPPSRLLLLFTRRSHKEKNHLEARAHSHIPCNPSIKNLPSGRSDDKHERTPRMSINALPSKYKFSPPDWILAS
jgi:hypothetical protein